MNENVRRDYLIPFTPQDIPGLVSFWNFHVGGASYTAVEGQAYTLQPMNGPMEMCEEPGIPLGGKALHIQEGQWLNLPRKDCPALDFHGPKGHFTLMAWIRRMKKSNRECEFVAGQWNESQGGRQYGLFLNIGVWQQSDQVCGHMSHVGGPTPGYKYCIDGPVGATAVGYDAWSVVGMSYDGSCGYAWLNGQLDSRPGLNPYSMAGGLNDGGENGSDFTVGSVNRHGSMGNFFTGYLAGLAVYNRALTPAEIHALAYL